MKAVGEVRDEEETDRPLSVTGGVTMRGAGAPYVFGREDTMTAPGRTESLRGARPFPGVGEEAPSLIVYALEAVASPVALLPSRPGGSIRAPAAHPRAAADGWGTGSCCPVGPRLCNGPRAVAASHHRGVIRLRVRSRCRRTASRRTEARGRRSADR